MRCCAIIKGGTFHYDFNGVLKLQMLSLEVEGT